MTDIVLNGPARLSSLERYTVVSSAKREVMIQCGMPGTMMPFSEDFL